MRWRRAREGGDADDLRAIRVLTGSNRWPNARTIEIRGRPLQVDEIAAAAREPDTPPDFSVHYRTGAWLYRSGPERLDTAPDQLIAVSPITDRNTEIVVGPVRVSRPRAAIADQTRRAWALLARGIETGRKTGQLRRIVPSRCHRRWLTPSEATPWSPATGWAGFG